MDGVGMQRAWSAKSLGAVFLGFCGYYRRTPWTVTAYMGPGVHNPRRVFFGFLAYYRRMPWTVSAWTGARLLNPRGKFFWSPALPQNAVDGIGMDGLGLLNPRIMFFWSFCVFTWSGMGGIGMDGLLAN